jgi:hypothetical protein
MEVKGVGPRLAPSPRIQAPLGKAAVASNLPCCIDTAAKEEGMKERGRKEVGWVSRACWSKASSLRF